MGGNLVKILLNLTCLSQFAIPGRDGPVISEQSHQSWLLIRVKRLVKESKLIEKLRSQHRKGIRRRRRLGLIVGTKDNAFFIILIGERLSSNFRTGRY